MKATIVSDVTEAIQENIRRANEMKLRSRVRKEAKARKPADSRMVELFKELCHNGGSK